MSSKNSIIDTAMSYLPFTSKSKIGFIKSCFGTATILLSLLYFSTHGEALIPIKQLGGYHLGADINDYPELVNSINNPNGNYVAIAMSTKDTEETVIKPIKPLVIFKGGPLWEFDIKMKTNVKTNAVKPKIKIYAINHNQLIYNVSLRFNYPGESICNQALADYKRELNLAYKTSSLGLFSDYSYKNGRLGIHDNCNVSREYGFNIVIHDTRLSSLASNLNKGIDTTIVKSILTERQFDENGKPTNEM